ncbi:Hsp20/alpha crystallin family protein [Phormidium sp. CCY1219]|uniref:Hsp20/alpha crystallin family protein n=1 Tax=Phormidium sp. CCY1219 TaxID=2886104 RepID=UPI002D1F6187|nr:Hsp20/alpha crystallin family protein [Phormidium sp. CCY1219]MEB3828543.1 Hsp20/alpha crystallin family protein [Phormidium sp. CCY1219]
MALIRYSPFREIDSLQREMNRLFDNLSTTNGEPITGSFVPPVEMEETPEAINLKMEVPGMEAKDLDVQVSAEAVAISGERKTETQHEENGSFRSEFRYGQFRRVIPLNARIENSKVEAQYKDGILKLHLPKAEDEKNKVVKVNVS